MTPHLVGLIAIVAVNALAFSFLIPTVLVWNGSNSAPVGLYRFERRAPGLGEFAYVSVDGERAWIVEGGYVPRKTKLIKRVVALTGDVVCRRGEDIIVNDRLAAIALQTDDAGRLLPSWQGCSTLNEDELFLLNDHPRSLDGRYFGPVRREAVIGVVAPIFVEDEKKRAGAQDNAPLT